MNENIKFSVIVPIYNVEKYLPECLESIIHQTYNNYEIICINDASIDASYEILLDYAERYNRIIVVNNDRNRGLSYNRNKGVEIATGDYIWFVDSDDYIQADALKILASYIHGREVEVLNFGFNQLNEGEYIKENQRELLKQYKTSMQVQSGKQWFVNALQEKTFSSIVCAKVFQKKFLHNNNLSFYEGIFYEDILYIVKVCICANAVFNVNDRLYTYRRRDSSITSTKTTKHLDSYVVIMNELMTLWKITDFEVDMSKVMGEYIQLILSDVRKLMNYFPEHTKIEVGKQEDQFFFENFLLNKKHNNRYVQLNQSELDIIRMNPKRIIYGAGNVATELLQVLEDNEIEVDAIVVTNKEINSTRFGKYTVCQIDELLDEKDNALVIVAVINRKRDAIKENLVGLGFRNIMLLDTERINTKVQTWEVET